MVFSPLPSGLICHGLCPSCASFSHPSPSAFLPSTMAFRFSSLSCTLHFLVSVMAGFSLDSIQRRSLNNPLSMPPLPPEFDDGDAGVELGAFDAKYLGSVSVKASQGNDVCADAVLRIRVSRLPERGTLLSSTLLFCFLILTSPRPPLRRHGCRRPIASRRSRSSLSSPRAASLSWTPKARYGRPRATVFNWALLWCL
jgi:hypothetical protein